MARPLLDEIKGRYLLQIGAYTGEHTKDLLKYCQSVDMINAPFYNARIEGGSKNGVLTAVEDFIKDSREPLQLFTLPVNNGLGIIYKEGSKAEEFIKDRLTPPPALRLILETCEIARINDIMRRLQLTDFQSRHRIRRLIGRFWRKIKKSWR